MDKIFNTVVGIWVVFICFKYFCTKSNHTILCVFAEVFNLLTKPMWPNPGTSQPSKWSNQKCGFVSKIFGLIMILWRLVHYWSVVLGLQASTKWRFIPRKEACKTKTVNANDMFMKYKKKMVGKYALSKHKRLIIGYIRKCAMLFDISVGWEMLSLLFTAPTPIWRSVFEWTGLRDNLCSSDNDNNMTLWCDCQWINYTINHDINIQYSIKK